MNDGVEIATGLRDSLYSLKAEGRFVAWAVSLPVAMGLVCLFCLDKGQSLVELPVLVCAVAGVLGAALGSGCLTFLVGDVRLRIWLRRSVMASLAFAAVVAACVALRLASLADSASFAATALYSWSLSFTFGHVVLYDMIAAAFLPLSFWFGAVWYWAGCALLKSFHGEQLASWRPSWVDCVADMLALLCGALMWSAWHSFVFSSGDDASFAQTVAGLFVPLLIVTPFSVGAWLRGARLHPSQLGRALAIAALGACAVRVLAVAVPWLLAPSYGLSLAALLVQMGLVVAFCVLAARQRPFFADVTAKDVDASHLSEGLNALLASYGLTDKEGSAHVLKEQGASSAQVGEMLGIKAPTVREYQRRARTKLGDEGMRRVREELRREEAAHAEEQLARGANVAGLIGASVEFMLVFAGLMAFGEACSFEGHADWLTVTLSTGLLVAWFALRILWLVGATGLSPQVKLAMRLVGALALGGLGLWCAGVMKVLSHPLLPDEAGCFFAFALVSAEAIRALDAFVAQAGLRTYGSFGVTSCLAVGFLICGCWQAAEGGGFGVELLLLCAVVLSGMFWLFGRIGLPAIWFAVVAILLLALTDLTTRDTLRAAVFLCAAVAFALLVALVGAEESGSEGHDVQCGIWGTPRTFDALLVIAGGGVFGMLLVRLNAYLLDFGGSQISGELGAVLLSGFVALFVLALGFTVVFGLRDVDAVLRAKRLHSCMDDAVVKKLEGELVQQGLTTRQARVALLLAEGWTPEEVADRLGYSRSTVSRDRGALYKMLGVHTRSGLVNKLQELSGMGS